MVEEPTTQVNAENVPVVSETSAEEKPTEPKELLTEPVMLKETPVEVKPDEENKEKKEVNNESVGDKNETSHAEQPEEVKNKKQEMLIIVPEHQHLFNSAVGGFGGVPQVAQNYPYQNVWNPRPTYSVFRHFSAPKQPKPEEPPKRFDPLGEFSDQQKRRQFYQDLLYTQLTTFVSKIEPMIEKEQNVTERNDMEELISHLDEFKQSLINHQLFNISQIMEDWKQGKIKEQDMPTPVDTQPDLTSASEAHSTPRMEPKIGSRPAEVVHTVLLVPNTFQANQYGGYRSDPSLFRRQFYASRPILPSIFRAQSPTYEGVASMQPNRYVPSNNDGGEVNYNNVQGQRSYEPNEIGASNYYQQ